MCQQCLNLSDKIMEKDSNKQITIVIGQSDYDDLTAWAYSHSKTPAEFASQIIAQRIEANLDVIKALRARDAEKAIAEREKLLLATIERLKREAAKEKETVKIKSTL